MFYRIHFFKDLLTLISAFLALSSVTWAAGEQVQTVTTLLGEFTMKAQWTVDPDQGNDVLQSFVSFSPDARVFPHCDSLKMIQIAQLKTNDGSKFVWSGAQTNRNQMMTVADSSRKIVGGYYVDHDASRCKKSSPSCSPYFRDSWPNVEGSQNGYVQGPSKSQSVSLLDYPTGWDNFEQIQLETCVACEDHEQLFDCIRWGATWPTIQQGSQDVRVIFQSREAAAPSPTFIEALKIFHSFY